jgi:hypothetical protein
MAGFSKGFTAKPSWQTARQTNSFGDGIAETVWQNLLEYNGLRRPTPSASGPLQPTIRLPYRRPEHHMSDLLLPRSGAVGIFVALVNRGKSVLPRRIRIRGAFGPGMVQHGCGSRDSRGTRPQDQTNPKRERGLGLPSLARRVNVAAVSPALEPCLNPHQRPILGASGNERVGRWDRAATAGAPRSAGLGTGGASRSGRGMQTLGAVTRFEPCLIGMSGYPRNSLGLLPFRRVD